MTSALALRKSELRKVAAAIAIVLAFAAMPSTAGIVIVSSPVPVLTLDICHPLPGFDRTTATILLARPAAVEATATLADAGSIIDSPLERSSAFSAAPDPPPPKPRA